MVLLSLPEHESSPIAYDNEVILDSLVVDVGVWLEQRHGDFGRADVAFADGGHTGSKPLYGPPCGERSRGKVQHRRLDSSTTTTTTSSMMTMERRGLEKEKSGES